MGERPNAPRCARTREPAIGDEYAAKLARGVVGALAREPVPQRGQVPGEDPFAETWTAPSPQAISRWRRALAMQDKSGLRLATADGVVVPPPVPPVAMHDAPDLRALETWAMETDRPAIATALKRDRLGMVEMAGGSGVSLIDPADLARLTLPARAWVLDEWIPKAGERGRVAAKLFATSENAAFLRCLDAATSNRANVAHRPGSNYAPRIFAAMPECKGYKPAAFERTMRRLVSVGAIGFDEPLWPGPNRHSKRGIARANGAPPLRYRCAMLQLGH